MKISKGTFKIREHDGDGAKWSFYEGSFGTSFPFYVHKKDSDKKWTLSHIATGYAVKKSLSLKQARQLCKALKAWPLFLMPDTASLSFQRDRLPTWKQKQLALLIQNNGESNE